MHLEDFIIGGLVSFDGYCSGVFLGVSDPRVRLLKVDCTCVNASLLREACMKAYCLKSDPWTSQAKV